MNRKAKQYLNPFVTPNLLAQLCLNDAPAPNKEQLLQPLLE